MPKDDKKLSSLDAVERSAIRFNIPKLLGGELSNLNKLFADGVLAGNGGYTADCEAKLCALTNAPKALLVHSCTAALEMAAILCDLGPGDEVIMPSFTFVSTANAVVLRGAVPVFVDVEPRSLNIDPAAVANAVSPRTKAIFAVHYAGVPADIDALAEIAKKHGLFLIEDAAQALGSSYRGRPCGSLGDMATFSFHETKNVTLGEGGALTVNNPALLQRAHIIRDKGTNRAEFLEGHVDKYTWVDIGSSYSPSEITAAVLLAQLENTHKINRDRVKTIERYQEGFADLAAAGRVEFLDSPEYCKGNGHLFCLRLRDSTDQKRFIAHLRSKGIEAPFHYVPLHSSPAGRKFGRCSGSLRVTEHSASRLVRLPIYFDMGDALDFVIQEARHFLLGEMS